VHFTSSSRATGNQKDPRSQSCHRRKTMLSYLSTPVAFSHTNTT
jgi:hypothetical protein